MKERLLLAVDPSEASELAVAYVARLLEGAARPTLVLLHVVPPGAKARVEEGILGALGPIAVGAEGALGAARGEGGGELVRYAEAHARELLERRTSELAELGFPGERVESYWYVPGPGEDLERGILREARNLDCDTIVVGRNALPWYRELFHVHVADRLAQHARGLTVWIVEPGAGG